MNNLVFSTALLLVVGGAMAQYRPFYAGNGVQYPRPFGSNDDTLGNRFGEGTDLSTRMDENGHDVKLVEDAAKLPPNQQPFWYINREQIRKHLGLSPATQGQGQAQPAVLRFRPSQPIVVPASANFA